MRRIGMLICGLVFFTATGQDKLSKLKAPTSPASVVLGIQPSTVLQPKSYDALEASLFSNFVNENGQGVIPNDFALEFTPYWTKNHGMSLKEYLYPSNGWDQVKRNMSFSLASTQNFLLGDSSKTNALAYGLRTTFYFTHRNDKKVVEEYEDSLLVSSIIKVTIQAYVVPMIQENGMTDSIFRDRLFPILLETIMEARSYLDEKEVKKIAKSILDNIPELKPNLSTVMQDEFLTNMNKIMVFQLNSSKTLNRFKDYIENRPGFSLDIAYAGVLNFPTNTMEFSVLPKQTVWFTPTFRFKEKLKFLKLIGVFRYEWYNLDYYKSYFPEANLFENNRDYGIAIMGEFDKFSIQFEVVGRNSSSKVSEGIGSSGRPVYSDIVENDLQYIGVFNYNISSQVVLSYSVGNKFDPVLNPKNTLVSQLSLNFGFGAPSQVVINRIDDQ